MQRHFKVTAPSVHQMVITLEQRGLIKRSPRVARSIEILSLRRNCPCYAEPPGTSQILCAAVLGALLTHR